MAATLLPARSRSLGLATAAGRAAGWLGPLPAVLITAALEGDGAAWRAGLPDVPWLRKPFALEALEAALAQVWRHG